MSSEVLPKNEDIRLACAFIPDATKRADVLSLFAFLETLRDIPDRTTEPLMGEIRLRWWYEAIEEIRDGRPVRYHPLTEALKALMAKYSLNPQALLDMVEGQMPLLDKGAMSIKAALAVVDSGDGLVARLSAHILGHKSADVGEVVRLYGMASLKARRGLTDAGDAELAHLRRDAKAACASLPQDLLPIALPGALAVGIWGERPAGPVAKRVRLTWANLTANI